MKKLLLFSIAIFSFALGSEQPSANLSHAQAAQLLSSFANLPEEIKCMVFPEYCPELNALVFLKPLPKKSKENTTEENDYWKTLLKPEKKVYQHWNLSYSFLKNRMPYFLYNSFPGNNTKLRRLGPNKNNILLLDNFLYDYSVDGKQYPYLKNPHKNQPRSDIVVSSNAQDLKSKYFAEQFFTCIHPTKNLFVGVNKIIEDKVITSKRISITNYDSVTKKIELKAIDTPEHFDFLVFDKSKLDTDALWAIDCNRKLWHLDKDNDTYVSKPCGLENVYSISQSSIYPDLLLVNGTDLYKTDAKCLACIKKFEHQTTFSDDKMSIEQGYEKTTKKEHAIIIKPLELVLQKARADYLSNKITKLKTQLLRVHQAGKAIV